MSLWHLCGSVVVVWSIDEGFRGGMFYKVCSSEVVWWGEPCGVEPILASACLLPINFVPYKFLEIWGILNGNLHDMKWRQNRML